MPAESGDAVVFDPRIVHSGEASTYRPGRLQKLLGRRIRPGTRAA